MFSHDDFPVNEDVNLVLLRHQEDVFFFVCDYFHIFEVSACDQLFPAKTFEEGKIM